MDTHALGDTLGDNGNGLNLGELHELHGGAVDTSRGGKVHNSVDLRVLVGSFADLLVDREEGLAGAPVHLADELATESVDNAGNGRALALADEVKVEHTLHSTGLQTVDEASGLVAEESMLREGAEGSTRGSETLDVIVGGQAALCPIDV